MPLNRSQQHKLGRFAVRRCRAAQQSARKTLVGSAIEKEVDATWCKANKHDDVQDVTGGRASSSDDSSSDNDAEPAGPPNSPAPLKFGDPGHWELYVAHAWGRAGHGS